jgi:hypothetical protein
MHHLVADTLKKCFQDHAVPDENCQVDAAGKSPQAVQYVAMVFLC